MVPSFFMNGVQVVAGLNPIFSYPNLKSKGAESLAQERGGTTN